MHGIIGPGARGVSGERLASAVTGIPPASLQAAPRRKAWPPMCRKRVNLSTEALSGKGIEPERGSPETQYGLLPPLNVIPRGS